MTDMSLFFTIIMYLSEMNRIKESQLLTSLGKRVKELRIKKGISQSDAYTDTGIHFGRLEQGRRDISFTTLKKICDYFEVSICEFLSEIE